MEDLVAYIQRTADRVRTHDFLWMLAISIGIFIMVAMNAIVPASESALIWLAFAAALGVRYRFSAGRRWARPIEELVRQQLGSQESELSTLRLARKVALALPEPLFILHPDGIIETTNPAANKFINNQHAEGRHVASVIRAAAVFEAVEAVAQDQKPRTVEFSSTGSVSRYCRAYIAPLDHGNDNDQILISIRDLTSEHRVEQMRVDFIASASHELRTPLASLLGFIETLRGPAREDPEATKKFLKIMQKQAERMQRLVADLMSLSRIELNEHILPEDEVLISEIVADVMEGLRPIIEKSEAIIEVDNQVADEKPLAIIGDSDEILQAAQNLVHNAIKYGGDPARIRIVLGRGEAPSLSGEHDPFQRAGDSAAQVAARLGLNIEDLVYLQVRDFGPGIERADLPRLTERFYRVNLERSRKGGGTGLGLAIVKHILNRHKGGLQIETRLAAGTAFTCYFAGRGHGWTP